ncbi:MAG: NADPH-dependent assimilatory sulfite reductase hemoprotein subunit [Blastopirellula sp.]|nr:MAG: NADPH-dependent assimilatory sulfite reductase hemoprotein subunit [Blastopirellula sp.]
MSEEKKLSPVDTFKLESNYLRGDIPEELADGTDHFGKSSIQLLKHYGMYQQDDRDNRGKVKADGTKGKSYMFMVRTKLPAGSMTSDQMMKELELCDSLANETLRITSRQGLQFHGIQKDNLPELLQQLKKVELTTLGACGDVNRNVMCCPAPIKNNPVRTEMQEMSFKLAAHFAPQTPAYREIFLKDQETGEKEKIATGEVEPLYGVQYLPRKFKMGIALPEDNCIDVYTHDLGLIAIVENDAIVGYNVLVGGGQGRTPSAEKTFPALGKKLAFITPDQVVDVAEAIVKVQRDNGNRADRKVARLKYLIHNWGMEKFKAEVEKYYGQSLPEARDVEVHEFDDHKGWQDQGDGNWIYGLNVENGRIKDDETMQLKTAIREICTTYNPGIHLTAHQDILFSGIKPEDKSALEAILKKHNVTLSEDISNTRRWSMACVAWPTCGLSITESERALPGMVDQLEAELEKLGLADEKFTMRMTGCPNGCARPYNCDIGLVGRAKEKYTVFLGGRLLGDRLSYIYKDMVPADEVIPELTKVFTLFKQDRNEGESFGDFCDRQGKEAIEAAVAG